MGTTLTGTTPQDTYDSLIKVTDNGPLSGTAKYLSDGLGNDSILALSTARVGVGTSSPATTLDVAGTLRVSSATPTEEFYNTTNGDVWASIFSQASGTGSGASLVFSTKRDGNSATDKMTITQAGNVGIGTSSPDTKLEIQSTSSAGASLKLSYDTLPSGTVITNDVLGQVLFEGLDASGGGTVSGVYGRISSIADGLWDGSPNRGADLTFSTAQYNGTSVVLSERLRILSGGGLTFNGDTLASNALDDYEEGTFTPTAFGVTTAGTTTYSGQNGYYTKIGRQVTVSLYLSYTSMTGTGTLKIGGLPFAIGNLTENYPVGSCIASAVNWTGGTYLQANGIINESNMYIVYITDDAAADVQQCVDESGNYRITMTYFTA